jgi:hypothetical protein
MHTLKRKSDAKATFESALMQKRIASTSGQNLRKARSSWREKRAAAPVVL